MKINRKIILYLGLTSLLSCSNGSTIYYVNPNKLMQGYHGAAAQHEVFQAKAKGWQQRIDSLGAELQTLSSAPLATRSNKEQQVTHYRDTIQQQTQQENQRLTKAVLDKSNA